MLCTYLIAVNDSNTLYMAICSLAREHNIAQSILTNMFKFMERSQVLIKKGLNGCVIFCIMTRNITNSVCTRYKFGMMWLSPYNSLKAVIHYMQAMMAS